MYIKNRDREILKFIEKYKSITINICAKIFYKDNKEAYQQARKRLRLLYKNKYLKRYRKDCTTEVIYYMHKKLSVHDLKVLDVLAELIYNNANIREFKREYTINTERSNYRADAFIEFTLKNYLYFLLIEVDHTHYTSFQKLQDIYDSNYFQNKYSKYGDNIFPTILILKRIVLDRKFYSSNFKIIELEYTQLHTLIKELEK
ncbi:hypothetical protein C3495_14520 (plasmid) [Clostridiaceae bacterium 14S0207]|nr:hypothetical protein C3495_14520 [Clostridiaceae bacterium 14S0207]